MESNFELLIDGGFSDMPGSSRAIFNEIWEGKLEEDFAIHISLPKNHPQQFVRGDWYFGRIANLKYLLNMDTELYRYIIVYNEPNPAATQAMLFKIAQSCAAKGDIWDEFRQYAAIDLEEEEWQLDVPAGDKVPGFEPLLSWRFENVMDIPASQEFYDERIIVDISWPESNQIKTFRGYWYASSVALIAKRLEVKDPYYRRFVQIAKRFDRSQLEYRLKLELDYIAALHPNKRENYLRYHFEHDNSTMFYER